MRELRLLPGVFDDTEQAARWYNEEGYEGLGDRFLGNFYSYLQHIQQHGESYRPIYHEFRRILLYPFPYSIYYRLESAAGEETPQGEKNGEGNPRYLACHFQNSLRSNFYPRSSAAKSF